MDFHRLAGEGLFERDVEIVAQVGAALATVRPAAATAAHELAEDVVENVGHRGAEAGVGTTARAPHAFSKAA